MMTTSDWIAAFALAVSGGALGLEVRRWFEGKARLDLRVMPDAKTFPDDDGRDKLALTVTNLGSAPTMLTHMIAFTFESRWKRFRNKPTSTGIVGGHLPHELGPNKYWIGFMYYTDELKEVRAKGQLYIGAIGSHSGRHYLIRVPPEKTFPTAMSETDDR